MSQKIRTLKDALMAADAALADGDEARAVELYSLVLAKAPKHSKAKKALQKLRRATGGAGGAAGGRQLTQADVDQVIGLLNAGDFESAVKRTRALVVIAPREALLPNILGMALANLGQSAASIRAFRKATKLRPSYPEAWANLGGALLEDGRNDEALAALKTAARLQPDLAQTQQNLAMALSRNGLTDAAMEAFDRALALKPDYVIALSNKGAVLRESNRLPEAVETLERAAVLEPGNTDVLTNLGYALAETDRIAEAISALKQVINADPADAAVLYRLGVLYSQTGARAEAIETLDALIALDPAPTAPFQAEAWRTRSTLVRFKADDPAIATMQALYRQCPAIGPARMHLAFALGKAMEDTARPDAAFDYWLEGNRLRHAEEGYERASDETLVARIRETFDPAFFERLKGTGSDSSRPVFITGMMRSGTTLVEQILASHSQVFGAGELDFINRAGRDLLANGATPSADAIGDMARGYLDLLQRLDTGHTRVVDKMPVNFLWIGLIHAAFPKATIINLRRDPRDTCLSIFKNYFDTKTHGYAYNLEDLGRYYVMYDRLMAHWDTVLPGVVQHVGYESLTQDFEAVCRDLLARSGLEWQDAVLAFHKTDRTVKTASVDQVRRKIYSSSVGGWRQYETGLAPLVAILENAGCLEAPRA